MLYARGEACLNARRVVSVVGTRRCTRYGQDLIHSFVHRLKELCPEMLVVSGLAYGVDIWAHRECLANETPTVGVLAHGLDDLYPRAHRETANRMVAEGGALLTEFMTHTTADKINFVRRNRIVAGMSDAVVLVESADRSPPASQDIVSPVALRATTPAMFLLFPALSAPPTVRVATI